MSELTFNRLNKGNVERCVESYHPTGLDEWSCTDWACALGGEVGEALNLVKKLRRLGKEGEIVSVGDPRWDQIMTLKTAIGKELADVVIYADLLATRLGLDLGQEVVEKFNEVSSRVKSTVKL